MTRLLLVAALAAAPLAAAPPAAAQTPGQNDPALAPTAAEFGRDLDVLARLTATAALVRERTGAFPATPFALLGSDEAGPTGARTLPLSALSVTAAGDSLVLRYVPLPVSPYVREDLVVTATVTRDAAGRALVRHEMRRYAAPADGGRLLLYDRAEGYRVERGYGELTVDVAAARRMADAGTFAPRDVFETGLGAPGSGPGQALTVRVHPTGAAQPVYFEGAAP